MDLKLFVQLSLLLLVLFLWGIFTLIVLRQKITPRQKTFIVLTFLPFAVVVLALPATILTQNVIFLGFAFLAFFPMLILLGIIQLLFAKDAQELYEFLRNKGGAWRWLVPALPKRESYLMRGIMLILIGTVFTFFLIYLIFQGLRAS